MAISLSGVFLPHRKNTADKPTEAMACPKSVTIPMTMHIGAPATPVVKPGDHVDVGTLIGAQNGYISSPVHSSVSGTVKKVDTTLDTRGNKIPSVTIESDGLMTLSPDIKVPEINSKEDFINAIRDSGIVGLGGAGFPSYVKLDTKEDAKFDYLLVNGAECEPYITSDTRTMLEDGEDILAALDVIEKYIPIEKIRIGIENNKRKAITLMKKLASGRKNTAVRSLSTLYPQGGEKVLVYHMTGRVISAGRLPADVRCIVMNCTTLAAIGKYLRTGIPLVNKKVTVDGEAVKEPKNLLVPIGTSVGDVFEAAGGFASDPAKVIYGGPMMGIAVPNMDAPILKNTNAIIAFSQRQAYLPKSTQCIHCGSCANQCPFRLNPSFIAKAYRNGDVEALADLKADLCMECGCCAYVCPSRITLVMTNKLAKNLLREARAKNTEGGK